MATVSLFRGTNMAAVTSCENQEWFKEKCVIIDIAKCNVMVMLFIFMFLLQSILQSNGTATINPRNERKQVLRPNSRFLEFKARRES